MHHIRLVLFACASCVALLAVPALAAAATAPSLKSPAANADPATEGGSMKFEWTGELQGDPAAIDRSFFRIEVIAASDMPSGAQTAWPSDKLENFVQTEPGKAVSSASLGVPTAGDYRWRACVWGVVDAQVDNVIQQLPGGCSASRVITTVAANATVLVPGELKIENRTKVSGGTRTVIVERPSDDATDQEPTVTQPSEPVEPVEQVLAPTAFQEVGETSISSGKGSALGGLGGGIDQAADRKGLAGAVIGGLGATLPFVPIPFWTLALLIACLPILVAWRRSVLAMFDWSDGSIDGLGTMDDVHGSLALVPVASDFKERSTVADGDAPAPASSVSLDAPDRRRPAA